MDDETYLKAGYMGEVTRNDVRAEANQQFFQQTQAHVGPIAEGDQFTIYMVRKVVKPDFDDVKETIRDRLFDEFIEGLPGTVKVEVLPLGTVTNPVIPLTT